ncbi:glycoside hydrolase family 81 protein, partial [Tortispora caseinolytica NRRL Y-17796]
LFEPIATTQADPAQLLGSREHPLPLKPGLDRSKPTGTNKFYGAWLVNEQTDPVWTHPYSLWLDRASSAMAVSYRPKSTFVFGGATQCSGSSQYYFAPIGVASLEFGACEIAANNLEMTLDSPETMSINCFLTNKSNVQQRIWFPTVQGMGFVSAKYFNTTPFVNSKVGFRNLQYAGNVNGATQKYRATLYDNSVWLVYATLGDSPSNSDASMTLSLQQGRIQAANSHTQCLVQAAFLPTAQDEAVYDQAAGTYVRSVSILGSYANGKGTLQYQYRREDNTTRPVLQFALPHHVEMMNSATKTRATNLKMDSTSKGEMQAFLLTDMVLEAELPNRSNAYFLPTTCSSETSLDAPYLELHADVLTKLRTTIYTDVRFAELSAESLKAAIVQECNLDSVYFSGKKLDKYAYLLLCAKYVLKDDMCASILLASLKAALQLWINNAQKTKLVYDSKFHGVVSTSGLDNSSSDFGNGYYNDHHFHYGYFVHAAAVVALVDPAWVAVKTNRTWVEMLVREISNPSETDSYFPVSRAFDWFHGHSWAKGLFGSGDGKDQESTSEDYHHVHGLMLWGMVTGDQSLEHRAAMQLAIMKSSFNHYFLYASDNKTMPAALVANKVSGILFENKIDHATYFSPAPECIHGIHMIPITAVSKYVRSKKFVQEEWDAVFRNRIDQIDSGWKGILYQNLSLVYPDQALRFFMGNCQAKWIDDGASWTYSLVLAAAM